MKIIKEDFGNYLKVNEKKALIIGLSGKYLTKNEKNILRAKIKPWGIILFKRNIHNYTQIKKLIKSIKNYTKDKKYPIMIDEEGVVFPDSLEFMILENFHKDSSVAYMKKIRFSLHHYT